MQATSDKTSPQEQQPHQKQPMVWLEQCLLKGPGVLCKLQGQKSAKLRQRGGHPTCVMRVCVNVLLSLY